MKKINTVIGVASGSEKKEAVLGCLNGKYINVLIIDEELAQSILYD